MNLADDAGAIVGHSLSWRGARPGLVARTLLEGPSAAPVILVDEIDKAGWRVQGDPTDVLLSLLEPENAQAFVDAYIEAPIRADHIQWLCTANDTAMLRTSLLDRLLVAPIEPPRPNSGRRSFGRSARASPTPTPASSLPTSATTSSRRWPTRRLARRGGSYNSRLALRPRRTVDT